MRQGRPAAGDLGLIPLDAYLADDVVQVFLAKAAEAILQLHLERLAEQIDLTRLDPRAAPACGDSRPSQSAVPDDVPAACGHAPSNCHSGAGRDRPCQCYAIGVAFTTVRFFIYPYPRVT